jgi:hypothetical protein
LRGNEKKKLDGIVYLEFIKLQVNIYESTGDIMGVWVEIMLWLVAAAVDGKVWAERPTKFPKAVLN